MRAFLSWGANGSNRAVVTGGIELIDPPTRMSQCDTRANCARLALSEARRVVGHEAVTATNDVALGSVVDFQREGATPYPSLAYLTGFGAMAEALAAFVGA